MMSHKQKLVYIVTKSSWGGAQRYVHDLATHFKDNFDVEIWCGANELNTSVCLKSKAEDAGIRVQQIEGLCRDISIFDEMRVLYRLYRMIKKRNPDILHLNSTKVGILGGIVGRLCKVNGIVFTAHGLADFEDRPKWQLALISAANRLIFLLSHWIILVSKFEFEYTKNWRHSERHVLIYNGISESRTASIENIEYDINDSLRNKLRDPKVIKFIGIGELHKNKGPQFTLEALDSLHISGKEFVYLHFGDGELRSHLEAEVIRLQLQNHVSFLGFKDSASSYLSHFDALIFPSLKEGLPYVVMEATLSGIKTFASRVGGIPEMIEEGVNGELHDAKDVKTLIGQLNEFIENGKPLRPYDFSSIQKKFSYEGMISKTKNVYKT